MNKTDTKNIFAIFALSLIILSAVIGTAAADTSVAWTKDIGDVTAVDMSEDGSVIYAAVGSQIFVYDAAGIQQNTFTVGGTVVKLVCTADGTKAALYTDNNVVYYINNGQITWNHAFTDITDIDISNAGSVLVVESTIFHKYMPDGSPEYDSASGTFNIGVIDPDDEFAIVNSNNNDLQKYILSTSYDYWAKAQDTSYITNFSMFQNLMILYTNDTNAIILNSSTLGGEIWDEIYTNVNPENRLYAVSDPSLDLSNSSDYYYTQGILWEQITSSAPWGERKYPCSWVFDNKIWIGGGLIGGTAYNDVWYSSDGQTWTRATSSAGWGVRYGACSWVYDNKMWIGGGLNKGIYNNEVWYSSDGQTWTRATSSAQWSARANACTWVFDNKMWIGGGEGTSISISNDVWYSSNGQSWIRATSSAGWGVRTYASSWVFDNKLWIGGGWGGGGTYYTDVWYSSNGQTWTQATSSQFPQRTYGSTWVYDNLMWVGGGQKRSTNNPTDLWCSSDGSDWTQVTSSTPWTGGYQIPAWFYEGKMWCASGASVWCIDTDPDKNYIIIQPKSAMPTYVFYNCTGASAPAAQTTYSDVDEFSGAYTLRTKQGLSIYDLQTTKSYTGNIEAISLSDRGDWLGTATTTRIYHDQVTSSGFGTEYYAALGSTGTVYDVATANSAAMSIVGQGQITDIYSMSASRVGTYTAGGAVEYVDIADKNALWAASGGEDGKVYIFSKDASSNWYLEYSSDSENPITALRMSARGEYILAGRTNSLTLYQTNTPEITNTEFWFTLYAYKDSDSYRNAAINVTQYIGNQWKPLTQGLTDSAGKYVILLTAGQTYKFDVGGGQKAVVVMASPSVTSQTVNIYTTPISAAITYEATWDADINGIDFKYNDNSGLTNSVTVKVQRTDTWETVYEQTFTGTQSIDEQLPIVDDTTSYKVEFSANRVSGVARNTYVLSPSRDIIPIPLDQNIKNVLFSSFLILLAGLFSYMSAIRGSLVVAFSATLFVYLGWLTIPWHWLIIAIVIAVVAGFTQRRG